MRCWKVSLYEKPIVRPCAFCQCPSVILKFMKYLFILAFCVAANALNAQTEVPVGSDLRASLFNLARSGVEEMAGRPVKFAGSLQQLSGYAFFKGRIVDKSGNTIAVGDHGSGDTVILWKKAGGRWELVTYDVGITDVSYARWPEQYGAPEELLFQ